MVQLSHPYVTTGKTIVLIWTFVGKVISLLFNVLSRFGLTSLPRYFNFKASVTIHSDLGAQENKICHSFQFFTLLFTMKSWDQMPWFSFFECWVSSQLFHSPFSSSSRGSLVSLDFLSLEWYHLHIWGCWYFSQKSWFQFVIHPAWHFTWGTLHIS